MLPPMPGSIDHRRRSILSFIIFALWKKRECIGLQSRNYSHSNQTEILKVKDVIAKIREYQAVECFSILTSFAILQWIARAILQTV